MEFQRGQAVTVEIPMGDGSSEYVDGIVVGDEYLRYGLYEVAPFGINQKELTAYCALGIYVGPLDLFLESGEVVLLSKSGGVPVEWITPLDYYSPVVTEEESALLVSRHKWYGLVDSGCVPEWRLGLPYRGQLDVRHWQAEEPQSLAWVGVTNSASLSILEQMEAEAEG